MFYKRTQWDDLTNNWKICRYESEEVSLSEMSYFLLLNISFVTLTVKSQLAIASNAIFVLVTYEYSVFVARENNLSSKVQNLAACSCAAAGHTVFIYGYMKPWSWEGRY